MAVKFLYEYSKYLQFHSTTSILKGKSHTHPRAVTSLSTGVDLWGQLQTIRQKASDNAYTSQFDSDWDLRHLISRAKDGHLTLNLCSQGTLHFEHGVPLLSISSDGLQIPEIYVYGAWTNHLGAWPGAAWQLLPFTAINFKTLAWQFLVCGSLAVGAQREKFQRLMSDGFQAHATPSNLHYLRSVLEECWENFDRRVSEQEASLYNWKVGMERFNMSILFI
ncbi:hypothetical protein BO71DRAFT_426396 [Aspergillus ellipticus CBS 707.79]|uniref:Uncharacterized protein n=1 Tax=Aspergillus ellipticus CBS 707.79 TaxID=1448320 RepID=A0A319DV70_9EURO|nr:hypothetical protein BO71DRAFT_426396 [Aspergillus ellipticus CBS 707.79]